MAISGLQQRNVPLLLSCPVWSPWGPGRTQPFEDDEEPSNCDEGPCHFGSRLQRRRRSLSWGGYSPHALVSQGLFLAESEGFCEEDGESDESSTRVGSSQDEMSGKEPKDEEPETPISTPKSPSGRAKSGRNRRRTSVSKESELSHPVLLGNTIMKGTELKMPEGRLANDADSRAQNRSKNLAAEQQEVTTLMVRNLPYSLTQQGLVEKLDASGFKGLFDFCYLPHKFNEHTNLGFAFLNFVSADAARKFIGEWHQSELFRSSGMRKSLNVTAAVVQGREANQMKACSRKMGRVRNASFKPWVSDSAGELLEAR